MLSGIRKAEFEDGSGVDSQQNAALIGREAAFADLGVDKPCGESIRDVWHRSPSRAMSQEIVYSVAVRS
jgi:hypothetical protein